MDIGAPGIDKEEMVEISSMEFAMDAVIAEAKALDPAMPEEVRRRMDWPKWDLAIKAELEVLKKAGTWGVIERLRGRNIVACKWVLHIKKDAARKIKCYKAQLIAKGFMASTIMRPSHLSPSLLPFAQYSLSLLAIIGPSACSTSTALSLTGNSMRMKKYLWSNHLTMKNPTHRNIASSSTSQSMDLNKPDTNGMRLHAICLQTWDLRSARPTQPSSIFTPARIF